MHLVPVDGALVEEVFDLTYPVWHEGLTRHAYARWNVAQLRTPWGRDHLQRVALVDSAGHILATAKRYRFDIRLDGREGWMCGLGAVFTPPDRRGRGHASALIDRLLADARRDGARLAALFSEIGTDFYARAGFHAVPMDEVTVSVRRKDGAPAMLVRAGEERDLAGLARLHDTRSSGARFALLRDEAVLRFVLARKRTFAGLSAPGQRQLEFFVAEEGASAVAYVILSVNAHGWTLEEAGDRDPAGARLGGMLQVLLAREPSRPAPRIRAWWPASFAVPPQVQLTERADPTDILMMRALADVEIPARASEVFFWHSDYF